MMQPASQLQPQFCTAAQLSLLDGCCRPRLHPFPLAPHPPPPSCPPAALASHNSSTDHSCAMMHHPSARNETMTCNERKALPCWEQSRNRAGRGDNEPRTALLPALARSRRRGLCLLAAAAAAAALLLLSHDGCLLLLRLCGLEHVDVVDDIAAHLHGEGREGGWVGERGGCAGGQSACMHSCI